MKRRELIVLLGAATVLPLAARAQQARRSWRIGMLDTVPLALNKGNVDAFRGELQRLGYVEGDNLSIIYRSSNGRPETFTDLTADLVRAPVDIIVTRGTPAARAAKSATSTLPIVMAAIGEPVETGLVQSLAKPGGNITGLSSFVTELTRKRVEIIRELVPTARRMSLLDNMSNGSVPAQWEEARKAATSLGMEARLADVRKPEDIRAAFETMNAQATEALLVGLDSVVVANPQTVAELAVKYRLPAIYASREFVELGGLMSYGTHYGDLYRRAAIYVDKILRGAKPSDLPVEQPTKFELVVNLKTAKSGDWKVSPALLTRADEVLE